MLLSRGKFAALGNIYQVLQHSCSSIETESTAKLSIWPVFSSYFLPIISLGYSLFYSNSGSRVNSLPWDNCEGTSGPFSLPNALHKVKETGLVHLYDILDKAEVWEQKTGQLSGFRLKERV